MSAAEPRPGLWFQRALPPVLGLGAIYLALLPLAPGRGAATPDLLYCLVIAFVIRAPRALPAVVVVLLGLFADLMLARPPGLGALGLFTVSELFRAPNGQRRGWSLPREWLFASIAFAAMIAVMVLALKLTFLDPPAPVGPRRHVVATAIAYPFVALAVGWLTGPRRRADPARGGAA